MSDTPDGISAYPAGQQVHGLDGSTAAADWPALRAAEVIELLDRYPCPGAVQGLLWHSPRPLSAAALVAVGDERLFVKRHHRNVRTPASLSEEHRFIDHLRAVGAAVPEVLRDAEGLSTPTRGEWVYEVHACAPGVDLYRDLVSWAPVPDLNHAWQAGRALAGFHAAAAGHDAAQRSTHVLVTRDELVCATDPVATLRAQLPQRPGLADYLRGRDWEAELAQHVLPYQRQIQARLAEQKRLWTHNDWHVSNLAWSDRSAQATVSAVFDFGLASPTCALFDLATAIERNAIAWLELDRHCDIAHPEIALALLAGYQKLALLSRDQRAIVADLLPVVHVDFALSEVEYFHAVTGSARNADIAWNTFLLGHARWFDSADARALQAAIADT